MVNKIARFSISCISPITWSVVFHFPYVSKPSRWALCSQHEQCKWDCSICVREAQGPCENRLSEPGSSHGAACQCNDWINTNQAPRRFLCVHTSLTAFHTINTNTAGFKVQVQGVRRNVESGHYGCSLMRLLVCWNNTREKPYNEQNIS